MTRLSNFLVNFGIFLIAIDLFLSFYDFASKFLIIDVGGGWPGMLGLLTFFFIDMKKSIFTLRHLDMKIASFHPTGSKIQKNVYV